MEVAAYVVVKYIQAQQASTVLPTTSGPDELSRAAHYGDHTGTDYWNQRNAPKSTPAKSTPSKPTGGSGGSAPQTQPGGGSAGGAFGGGGENGPVGSCGCGDSDAIRSLYHGTTWNAADDIAQNGIRDPGRDNGDPDFYTTPDKQLAADWSGQRVTDDNPYRAILRFDVPESVLDAMKANGLAREDYFLNSDAVEVRFKPGSWATLMQYLTAHWWITGPREEGC